MDEQNYEVMQQSLVSIATELFRFQSVLEKAVGKLEMEERVKYLSQFSWFSKKVTKALEAAGFSVLNLAGMVYDPGMAISPINIDDFGDEEALFVRQMIEPVIMKDSAIIKTGTVILGRIEE